MKRLLFLLVPVLLLGACRNDDTKIYNTKADTLGFHTVNDHSQVGEILHPGDTIWAHTVPTVQISYDVKANTLEQWSYAWKHWDVAKMILGLIIFGLIAGWFIKKNNTGLVGEWSVWVLIGGMLIGLSIVGTSLGWWDGFETWISKDLYDAFMKQDGNLHNFFKKAI